MGHLYSSCFPYLKDFKEESSSFSGWFSSQWFLEARGRSRYLKGQASKGFGLEVCQDSFQEKTMFSHSGERNWGAVIREADHKSRARKAWSQGSPPPQCLPRHLGAVGEPHLLCGVCSPRGTETQPHRVNAGAVLHWAWQRRRAGGERRGRPSPAPGSINKTQVFLQSHHRAGKSLKCSEHIETSKQEPSVAEKNVPANNEKAFWKGGWLWG